MRIELNGEAHETEVTTVAALLQEQNAPERGVAIALNGQVVRRAEHATTAINEGDRLEIIRAVQGG
jgi:sulfur carrier protein